MSTMVAVIATLRTKDGMADEFESLASQLAEEIRTNEPGNIAYQLCRSRTEANSYKILEIYRDKAALEAHGQSEHFKAAGAKLGAVLNGRPEIEYLDAIG